MVQFLNSVFTGASGTYQILGAEVIFDGTKPSICKCEGYHYLTELAHYYFNEAFSCITLKRPQIFAIAVQHIILGKLDPTVEVKEIKIRFTRLEIHLKRAISLHKLTSLVRILFETFLFMSAKTLSSYISKPVAVVIATSSLYWGTWAILVSLGIRNILSYENYGWKGKTAVVATYALSVFAASHLI